MIEKISETKILSWNVNGPRTRFKKRYLKQVFDLKPIFYASRK